ncbi:Mn-dependent transcriptional regulator [Melioribacter roseus P3M-2]|jgi:DtxR family Mn-dependent transcriptional regulator|uniref:Transcriptional regulator MntR n=1 Tax=Melioribacter roseus (strain DSM 23840 / JCM 17771 / VKM B-2668 / P3M-2) TaxID=1191523 RepID=I6ZSR5_MELRP|nr:metal-dependent transcriptional regulator [Melioribacter roseus]AFN75079.1 Mn-dependent transcriptional regulator [Melioribacter roseus P3M-2]
MTTISKENYLKLIYNFHARGIAAATSQMAKELNVSNSAISDMAKKLSKEGLIEYEKYKGMKLTRRGELEALKVLRKHRLWEMFLQKALEIPWSKLHDEAERLEHHTSEYLIDKIDSYLGFPRFDPHGHPIPKKDGTIEGADMLIPMLECINGKKYKLKQVDDKDGGLIKYLSDIDLILDTEFEFVDRIQYDNSIKIRYGEKEIILSEKVASNLLVKELTEKGV